MIKYTSYVENGECQIDITASRFEDYIKIEEFVKKLMEGSAEQDKLDGVLFDKSSKKDSIPVITSGAGLADILGMNKLDLNDDEEEEEMEVG